MSRPALRPTQPRVQWVSGLLSPGLKCGRGVMLSTRPHLVPRSRMRTSYTSSPPCASMLCCGTALLILVSLHLRCLCVRHVVITDCRKWKKYEVGIFFSGIKFIPNAMKIIHWFRSWRGKHTLNAWSIHMCSTVLLVWKISASLRSERNRLFFLHFGLGTGFLKRYALYFVFGNTNLGS
jgi:hypothetical protein